MKKINFKDVIKSSIPLVLICLVISFLLAFVNLSTKSTIEKEKNLENENARKTVLTEASSFKECKIDDVEYYKGFNGDNLIGYVFLTDSKGYGGKIEVMTGITSDGKVSGVSILSQNETPGLGANIKNDNFKSQFNKKVPSNGFTVVKTSASNNNEIEAVTGATISSKAATTCVNEAIKLYNKINIGN